ncbi:hypothetical protein REPUB_Repub02eG0108100 [Reevesia pubescens]
MECPFIPTKKNEANEVVPNSKFEWTTDDKAKVQINFKAIYTLHCALNLAEFNRISTCNNVKEIWDMRKVTYEWGFKSEGVQDLITIPPVQSLQDAIG